MADRPPAIPQNAEEISVAGFNRFIGPLYRLADEEAGAIKHFAFVAIDKHMNAAGTVHGGMLMTFMDVAMSQAARAGTTATGSNTVSLTCDFVGPGKLGDLIEARVRLTRRTRTMVFLSGELRAGDRVLLVGTGLWKIVSES